MSCRMIGFQKPYILRGDDLDRLTKWIKAYEESITRRTKQ